MLRNEAVATVTGNDNKVLMRIIQFMASGGYGGAERVFVELSNALAERHEVTALVLRTFPASDRERFLSDVNVVVLESHPTVNNPFLHYELFKTLRGIKPDLVHTHAVKASELVNRVNTFIGLPHLGTKHNDRKGRIFNRLRWVSTVSEKARQSVFPRSGSHIEVIYNGVVEELVKPSQRPEIFTILAVGRLDKIKGFDLLLRQIAPLTIPYRLVIVGEGPEHNVLLQLIGELGLENRVELTGFREDIAQMMSDANMVVISSHREGGPKVLIEALFYAPLLVSTPVGAVPEVLPKQLQTSLDTIGEKIGDAYNNYIEYTNTYNEIRLQKKSLFLMSDIVSSYERFYQKIVTT